MTTRLEWQNPEKGFYVGYRNSIWVCSISKHWTGFWLDGFGIPIVCGSLEEAQARAEEEIKINTQEKNENAQDKVQGVE